MPKQQQLVKFQIPAQSLEFPSEPLSLDSKFYIPRYPIEELAWEAIAQPGSITRIKAPRKTGKSSLLLRIIDRAAAQNYRTVSLDFQQADKAVFANLNKFLRWFSANVSRELQLESKLDDYWDEEIGSKVSCTIYFQAYLLAQIQASLVLALNEVNLVFEYPEIAQDFLPLLRYWHEQAKRVEIWQKLRLVVTYSTEIYVPLHLNQSPFNVGLPLKLPPFTVEQVQDLAQRYGLNWLEDSDIGRLMLMVGGHPYLVHLAFYYLSRQQVTLKQLWQEAATEAGIYNDYLRQIIGKLEAEPQLKVALQQVILAVDSVKIEPILAYKLDSLGLVSLDGDRCTISCELYRLYFGSLNLEKDDLDNQIKKLQQANQDLKQLCNLDELTQLANRRHFNEKLEQQWQILAKKTAPLSIIFCDIDYFKIYNDYCGHPAGDDCLRQVASAIRQSIKRYNNFVARYGGEEFVIILPNTEAFIAVSIAESIRENVKSLAIAHDTSTIGGLPDSVITISLGVACTIPQLIDSSATLLQAADQALYLAKKQGRDRVCVSSTLDYGLLD
jgi:diguanylate cyclase (GGDEF)-like protein